jgi:hypothetical protein
MPNPMINAVTLAVSTVLFRSNVTSSSGRSSRDSTSRQTASSTTASTNNPTTGTEPQPHARPSLTATSSATSPPVSSSAPARSTRPGDRTVDSATKARTATIPATVTTSIVQKIHCQPSASTMSPGSTSPTPNPMPNVALIQPIATGTRSRGNCSRTMPKASGKVAAPTPWTARAAISVPMSVASAASRVPAAATVSAASSTRRLPNMSPSLPSSPVATDAVSRNALSTQDTVVGPVSSARCRSGSAGTGMVWSREKERTASSRAIDFMAT